MEQKLFIRKRFIGFQIFRDVGEEKLVIDIGWLKGREHKMLARQGSPDPGKLFLD